MDEISEKQTYELAIHLPANLPEKDLEERKKEIEEIISKRGGLIQRLGDFKRIKLAYPIKRERFSNFGVINFFIEKESIEGLNKDLKLYEGILRHLIITKRELRKVIKPASIKPRIKKPKEEPKQISKEKTFKEGKVEEKDLDKRIEEILEKL